MKIETKMQLNLQIKNVIRAVEAKNHQIIANLRELYMNQIKVPKVEYEKERELYLFSEEVSFHLLSIYFLLDLIDYFWDEESFSNREFHPDLFLYQELKVENESKKRYFHELKPLIEPISYMLYERLFVFLMPYEYSKPFVLRQAYPGSVLIVYTAREGGIAENFYKGVGKFHFEHGFKGILPRWAKNYEHYEGHFVKNCRGEPSNFN